jgi:hypothetical protein
MTTRLVALTASLTTLAFMAPLAGQQAPAAGRGNATAPPPIVWPSPPDGAISLDTGPSARSDHRD